MSRGETLIQAATSADVSPPDAGKLLTGPFPDPASSLTISHLWLADAVARRFKGRGQDLDDLRQIARCGLLEAADMTPVMERSRPSPRQPSVE